MQTAHWQKIEKIFFKAVSLPENEQREFVKKCSGDNDKLYCEICILIDKDNQRDCFLDKPVFKIGAKILAKDDESRFGNEDFENLQPQ